MGILDDLTGRTRGAAERLGRSAGRALGVTARAVGGRATGAARDAGVAVGQVVTSASVGWTSGMQMVKAQSGLVDQSGRRLAKQKANGDQPLEKLMQGWTSYDPTHYSAHPQAIATPGPLNRLSYDMLRMMVRVPFVATIVHTRCNEVGEMATPQSSPFSLGFVIETRERKKTPTKAEQKEIERLSGFFSHCGFWTPDQMVGRDNLEVMLRKIVRDSLTYDQVNFEIIPGRGGKPGAFVALPAHTIRLARPHGRTFEPGNDQPQQISPSDVAIVQVIRNQIKAEWTAKQCCWGVRRPRTDIESCGYGWPELEEVVEIVTYLLWGTDYNASQFRQGFMGEGIMSLMGDMPEHHLDAFRREFQSLMSGVTNAWTIPIVNFASDKAKLEWTDFRKNNRDMEFSTWLNWLYKVLSSVYQFDPAQAGFVFGLEGQTSSMGGQQTPMDRVKLSRDKGLRPLLRSIAYWFNDYLVEPLNPDFLFRFAGYDAMEEQDKLDLDIKRLANFMTVNEMRGEYDLDEREDGDVILNQVWLQAKQGAEMGGEEGEGEEGEGGFPELPGMGDEGEAEPESEPPASAEEPPEEKPPPDLGDIAGSLMPEGTAKAAPVPSWMRSYEVRTVLHGPDE